MKSSRGRHLPLVVCDDVLNIVRMDNHICISDQYITSARQGVVKLKKNTWGSLFSKGNDAVLYPVMFTSDLNKNQIFIPPEICRDLALKLNQKLDCVLDEIQEKEWADINKVSFVIQNIRNGMVRGGSVEVRDLAEAVRASFGAYGETYPLQNGQIIVVPYLNVLLELRVEGLQPDSFMLNAAGNNFFRMTEATQINFVNECAQHFKLNGALSRGEEDDGQLSEVPLDFVAKGIGGYKKEIALLIRSIFYSRAMKKSLLDAYGVTKHSKGILLYGPPGTGKTLIAKTIGGLFSKEAVKVIQGPELKNSYYGATQQNLADLFVDAKRNPKKLYVYIFDEIDSLFVTRGSDSSVGTSNNNDLVSRFLSILEGPEALDNVIIIGTTNRKELIDPALLRAGRLETHIYIGLPDEKDRLEILRGHTLNMSQTLAADVNLTVIANLAKNYSGAELARVVSVARGYALGKNFDAKNDKLMLRADIKSIQQMEKVTQQYFLRALKEVRPMFGVDEASLLIRQGSYIFYEDNLVEIAGNFQQSLNCLHANPEMAQLNYLISGAPGTGKTSLAHYLASVSQFPHVQILTAGKLLSESLPKQMDIIDEVFARARQSTEPSVIILDTIEDLIEATPDYLQYNNRLRLKLNEVLKDARQGASKILVMVTTNNPAFLQRIGLASSFDESSTLGRVRLDCRDKKKCAAQLSSIAASLGINTINDISEADRPFSLNIAIRDLIYQLRKYAAKPGAINGLKLGEFMRALPAEYHEVQQADKSQPGVSVIQAANFFQRAGDGGSLKPEAAGNEANVKQNQT